MAIKIQLFFLLCLLSSCAGYVKGDLQEDQIDQELTFKVKKEGSQKEADFTIDCNGKIYPLKMEYDLQESSWSTEVMSTLSVLTLGIIPLYSSNDLNLKISLYKDQEIFALEAIDSRAHFYYGIIPLLLTKTKDNMNCNEGEGTKGCLYRVAQTRSVQRLHRILRENGKLNELCN